MGLQKVRRQRANMSNLFFLSLALLCSSAFAQRFIIYDNFGRAALEVKYQSQGIQTYRDEGTGAYNYLGIWEPAAFQNYYMIGMKAQNDWSQMRGNIEMIRGFTGGMEQIYLRQPLDFQQIQMCLRAANQPLLPQLRSSLDQRGRLREPAGLRLATLRLPIHLLER